MATGTNAESTIGVGESFFLSTENWSTFEFADEYVAFRLGEVSGADVSIRQIPNERKIQVDAIGTNAQINQVRERLAELNTKSLHCERNGFLSVFGYLIIFFEGAQIGENELKFEEYTGPCQRAHDQLKKYIPRLLSSTCNCTPTEADRDAFQTNFLSQWQTVKKEYNEIFHGELCLVLTFGNAYFMNITKSTLSIEELNERYIKVFPSKFEKVLSRSADGLRTQPVPYSHSFLPICSQSNGFKEFLDSAFKKEKTEKTVKVRIHKLGMVDLDENLDFLQLYKENIKWFNGYVIRKSAYECLRNQLSVKCKMQSYRNVNQKALQSIPKYSHLLGVGKLCKRDRDGEFIVLQEEVTFIREKETEIYSTAKLWIEREVNRPIRVEVSKISEYEVCSETKRCIKRPERLEIAVVPLILDLKAPEEDIVRYANDLWDIALFFAKQLDMSDSI